MDENSKEISTFPPFLLWLLWLLLLPSCEEPFESQAYNVSGKVEKGPFISGSTITIQPLDSKLQALGTFYATTIQDNLGNFSFASKMYDSPYAQLMANGYFFHEVTGQLSSGTLNLRALVDLSDKETVNVNILTHLKYRRIEKLVADGKSFSEANRQAQEELFTAFGLQRYVATDASSFSIVGGTDESAMLIVISSWLIVDKSEAALTECLAALCQEFGENGAFKEETRRQLAKDMTKLANRLPAIRNNVITRYEAMGLAVEVKNLVHFLDWDSDGVAGNEILQEGEKVVLETDSLDVPNEGGIYVIHIDSPIPVYLEPQMKKDSIPNISTDIAFTEIYENISNAEISLEKSIEDKVLTIKLAQLNSRLPKSASVPIYDYLGNVLAQVAILQKGNTETIVPQLGRDGKLAVASFAKELALGFSYLNLVEQYYYYNKMTNLVSQYIYPASKTIDEIWSAFFRANNNILLFKEIESRQLGLYLPYFNVFRAICYYYLVIMWGDVPYITASINGSQSGTIVGRTSQDKILDSLTVDLKNAIDDLEDKRNESLTDENNFFFVSKDVARIVLANIYLYRGDYLLAEELFSQVIANGFYELDISNYNRKETIDDLWNNGSGKETIFAFRYNSEWQTRAYISIEVPNLVPVMTCTELYLSYAECLYKNGKSVEAWDYIKKVVSVKNITVSGENPLEAIKDARWQLTLFCNTNFAFLKRTQLAQDTYGVQQYNLLLPIPESEILYNAQMIQNPGY